MKKAEKNTELTYEKDIQSMKNLMARVSIYRTYNRDIATKSVTEIVSLISSRTNYLFHNYFVKYQNPQVFNSFIDMWVKLYDEVNQIFLKFKFGKDDDEVLKEFQKGCVTFIFDLIKHKNYVNLIDDDTHTFYLELLTLINRFHKYIFPEDFYELALEAYLALPESKLPTSAYNEVIHLLSPKVSSQSKQDQSKVKINFKQLQKARQEFKDASCEKAIQIVNYILGKKFIPPRYLTDHIINKLREAGRSQEAEAIKNLLTYHVSGKNQSINKETTMFASSSFKGETINYEALKNANKELKLAKHDQSIIILNFFTHLGVIPPREFFNVNVIKKFSCDRYGTESDAEAIFTYLRHRYDLGFRRTNNNAQEQAIIDTYSEMMLVYIRRREKNDKVKEQLEIKLILRKLYELYHLCPLGPTVYTFNVLLEAHTILKEYQTVLTQAQQAPDFYDAWTFSRYLKALAEVEGLDKVRTAYYEGKQKIASRLAKDKKYWREVDIKIIKLHRNDRKIAQILFDEIPEAQRSEIIYRNLLISYIAEIKSKEEKATKKEIDEILNFFKSWPAKGIKPQLPSYQHILGVLYWSSENMIDKRTELLKEALSIYRQALATHIFEGPAFCHNGLIKFNFHSDNYVKGGGTESYGGLRIETICIALHYFVEWLVDRVEQGENHSFDIELVTGAGKSGKTRQAVQAYVKEHFDWELNPVPSKVSGKESGSLRGKVTYQGLKELRLTLSEKCAVPSLSSGESMINCDVSVPSSAYHEKSQEFALRLNLDEPSLPIPSFCQKELFTSEKEAASKMNIHIEGLDFQPVPGDQGHCLYHAVGLYLGKSQDFLRKIVATHLEHNLEEFRDFITFPHGRSIEDYLHDVRNGREWGSHVEIEVLMRVLDRPIIVIEPGNQITNPHDAQRFTGEPIFVFYNGHTHYDALLLQEGFDSRHILQKLLTNMGNVTDTILPRCNTPRSFPISSTTSSNPYAFYSQIPAVDQAQSVIQRSVNELPLLEQANKKITQEVNDKLLLQGQEASLRPT